MDVAHVVDDQAQSKGELVSWVGESCSNLLVVCGALVGTGVGQHTS